jgi:hypothetical protein
MLIKLMKFNIINIYHDILLFYADIFTKSDLYVWTDYTELYIENKGDILQTLYKNTNTEITFIFNNQQYSY